MGFKVHVVRAGDFKGAGQPGTEVTADHLKEFQRNVDSLNEHFLAAVQSGRGMTAKQVKELADGRVHVGQEALSLGLVDAVSTFDQALSELAHLVSTKTQTRSKAMAEATTPQPATLTELKASFASAGSDFVLGQLEAGATMDQAKVAFQLHQKDQEIAKLKADHEAAMTARTETEKKSSHGFDPVGGEKSKATSESSAIAAWNAAIDEKVGPKVTRQQAAVMVAKEQPQLREAYVAEYRQQVAQRS